MHMTGDVRLGRLPTEITGAPMRTVRPVMLRGLYANPEKELVRLRANGLVVKVAPGTYIAKPDTVAPDSVWKPVFEEAAMAYATAAYGDQVPVLTGLGAARHWHAIPRAIGVTVITVPEQHRPVILETGGRIVFTRRDNAAVDAIPVQAGLGLIRVTRIEQTLVDVVLRPDLGGMPAEARAAALALVPRADPERLVRLVDRLRPAARTRMRTWLAQEGRSNG